MKVKIKSKMLSLKGRMSTTEFKKTYYDAARRLFRDATRAYLQAMIERMALDTGMSRATLLAVAGKVGYRTALSPYASGGAAKAGHKSNYGFPVPNNVAKYKSRSFGERLGQQAYVLEFGSVNDPRMQFQFKPVAIQHLVHEKGWNSIQAGEIAFNSFIKENAKDYLPSARDWLVNGRVIRSNG